MKKIALDVETLAVDSFETVDAAEQARGTVEGNEEMLATPGRSCYRTACCPETTLC